MKAKAQPHPIVENLGELDLSERLRPFMPRWVAQLGIGLACAAIAALVRMLLDAVVPGGAVFALIFPAAMLATFFARWQAGAVAGLVLILYTWFFLYPVRSSFRFAEAAGSLSVASVAISVIITVAIAELFRAAARRATRERDRQIAERDLFLAEFDHRVKNNFAVVASLLDMQRRRAREPATADALGAALNRVDSIARAHRHLYRGDSGPTAVDMATYLGELCDALSKAQMLYGAVHLECHSDTIRMPRDRAVSIGLIVNELVTNASKHAFSGRASGTIEVSLRSEGAGYVLTVADDGIGMPTGPVRTRADGGLGQKLIEAFARQARATMTMQSGANGTKAVFHLDP
ncbi:sensor histidine kinase [Stakelama sp. CBK3Z-3]|uniref:histidine kinase n=1 Tax=Stakelama flava TaxID=2860338 RepID=A0ABS6XII1_9SPHN|nr:sensor histidine kinase [Stakelama flava]MBW4330002.1 sensor histidine kinase [Stakelama flava]